jgi:hypothetical protein
MIRYSSYGCRNNREAPSKRADLIEPLEAEYRKLQELRERVRKAEAAAAQRTDRRSKERHPCDS